MTAASRPPERPHTVRIRTMLLLLSAVAGWVDALSYLRLGEVFTSFVSGNVVFVGLALQQEDPGLLVRAAIAVAGAFTGAVLGAATLRRGRDARATVPITGALRLEAIVLLTLAAVWHLLDEPEPAPGGPRLVLIALAAIAMGIQSTAMLALKIRGMMTTAITATLAALGSRLVHRSKAQSPAAAPGWLLAASIAAYVASALAVATTRNQSVAHLLPAVGLVVVLAVGRTPRPRPQDRAR